MDELTQQKKQAILYDTLPHNYIKKMKEVNKTPLEMPLEELLSYALNIEEAAVNPTVLREIRTIMSIASKRPRPQFRRNREVEKANIKRNVVETSPYLVLTFNKELLVLFVAKLATRKLCAVLKLRIMPLLRKT
jgi:hypothetical protein